MAMIKLYEIPGRNWISEGEKYLRGCIYLVCIITILFHCNASHSLISILHYLHENHMSVEIKQPIKFYEVPYIPVATYVTDDFVPANIVVQNLYTNKTIYVHCTNDELRLWIFFNVSMVIGTFIALISLYFEKGEGLIPFIGLLSFDIASVLPIVLVCFVTRDDYSMRLSYGMSCYSEAPYVRSDPFIVTILKTFIETLCFLIIKLITVVITVRIFQKYYNNSIEVDEKKSIENLAQCV